MTLMNSESLLPTHCFFLRTCTKEIELIFNAEGEEFRYTVNKGNLPVISSKNFSHGGTEARRFCFLRASVPPCEKKPAFCRGRGFFGKFIEKLPGTLEVTLSFFYNQEC